MVFSNLLRTTPSTSALRNRRASSGSPQTQSKSDPTPASPIQVQRPASKSENVEDLNYIASKDQIPLINYDDPELKELNTCLGILSEIFPDVQVEVFREMLTTLGEQSRLAVVTEALIKDKKKWAEGRLRIESQKPPVGTTRPYPKQPTRAWIFGQEAATKDEDDYTQHSQALVPKEETFRTPAYKLAVKNAAYSEFRGLSHSTVKAVLAEHNHSYIKARPTLAALNARSWRFSFTSIFSRKKTNAGEQNPWVIWHSSGQGSIYPTLKTTGNAELDRELWRTFVEPVQAKSKQEREEKDHAFALELNEAEATEADALHDCECCYTATTFEDLAACTEGGHMVCFTCVRHAANEAVFGQGWARNMDAEKGSLRCLAPQTEDCLGCLPQALMRRAVSEEKGGEDVLRKLDERLAEDNLLKSQLPLVRCPFCSYAEIDQIYLPSSRPWRIRRSYTPMSLVRLGCLSFLLMLNPFFLNLLVIAAFTILLSSSFTNPLSTAIRGHFSAALHRLRKKQHGLRFNCQNPQCLHQSCTNCSKRWSDVHICHESSLLALRTEVETAMSLAIKRTCPRCSTSFVKSSGCNKLTCVCGYQMCYICRADIGGGGEGYRHFCEHFRPAGGGQCTECEKCDLYRTEDEDKTVERAKVEAERKWVEKEGEADIGLKKVLVGKYEEGARWKIVRLWRCRPGFQDIFDGLVEFVVE